MPRSTLAAIVCIGALPGLAAAAATAQGPAAVVEASASAQAGAGADETRPAAEEPFTLVEFRDLFDQNGKASDRAKELHGRRVAIMGFFAPPPTRQSPFRVMVGAPTAHCPYCTAVNEREHLPYVLVYPKDESFPPHGERSRFVVGGRLNSGHAHEELFGLHYDIRILEAQVMAAPGLRRRLGKPADEAEVRPAGTGRPQIVDMQDRLDADED